MATESSYLYGIVPAGAEQDFSADCPIGIGGGAVHTVSDGGIGIVASKADPVAFSLISPEQTLGYLAQHQRVLERVMLDLPVIPLKFGTYARDDRQIVEILHCGQRDFARTLDQYHGKVEVDLAAFWTDMKAVLGDIARDEAVVSMKARIAQSAQPTAQHRVGLGQLVKTLLDGRREQVAGQLVAALRAQWPDLVVNPPQDDSMILSAALLIGRNEQARLDSAIHQLDRLYEDRLRFRCVGPLPPYSFATVEIKTVEARRLDAARCVLGLGESASLAEIKAAYRRCLQRTHPDRNAEAGAGDAFQEIADAYELLEGYALNYKHTFGPTQGSSMTVAVRSLNDLRAAAKGPAGGAAMRRQDCLAGEAV